MLMKENSVSEDYTQCFNSMQVGMCAYHFFGCVGRKTILFEVQELCPSGHNWNVAGSSPG